LCSTDGIDIDCMRLKVVVALRLGIMSTATVNLDDAILTSKVRFGSQEAVLVLTAEHLCCREFANSREAFKLPLRQMLTAQPEQKDSKQLVVTGIFANPNGSQKMMNINIVCATVEEVSEWVDTLNSIITDNNIRLTQANEEAQIQAATREAAAVAELKQMFPDVDDELLLMVLQEKRGDTAACIEPLLAMSDPNYVPSTPATDSTATMSVQSSTPQDQIIQDEILAKMLQDELFVNELNGNEEFQRSTRAAGPNQSPSASTGPTIAERLQTMSAATKKTISDLYSRFSTKANSLSNTRKSEPVGQEMVSLTVRPTEEEYPDLADEDEDDENDALLRPSQKSKSSSDRKFHN